MMTSLLRDTLVGLSVSAVLLGVAPALAQTASPVSARENLVQALPQEQAVEGLLKSPVTPQDPPAIPAVTLDTVDDTVGPLTAEIASRVFAAYGSPLDGPEAAELVDAFQEQGLSAWIGLAIIAQESSFANLSNNTSLDERNVANPFSVHFTSPKKWPGCAKNALLIYAPGQSYIPTGNVNKKCAAANCRLPTFAESAQAAAEIVESKGLAAYRETFGYESDLNQRLNNILHRINLAPR